MNKNMKIVFTASVLLNLLLAGIMAGYAVKCRSPDPWSAAPAMAKLSPQGKTLLKDSFDASRATMEQTFRDAKQLREKLNAILQADTFDADAYAAASAALREHQVKIMEQRAKTAGGLAAKLSPEDRRLMADWLSGPGRPGWRKGMHRFGPYAKDQPVSHPRSGEEGRGEGTAP